MNKRVQVLLSHAVEQSALHVIGFYTSPKSWGVYEIEPRSTAARKRFRFGNHPVRQHELEREFGVVRNVALFTARSLAVELASVLNARHSV